MLEGQLDEVMRTSDVDALDQMLADDLVFTGSQGRTVGKTESLARRRPGERVFEQVHRCECVVRRLANLAVVALRLRLAGRRGGRRFEAAFHSTRV
jgi:hypothetical protein